jgi:benzoate transport
MINDPRETILQSPMSVFQIVAIAVTFGLNAMDGYDVLAITFASPGIAAHWGIDRASLGIVISMGLIGMTVGSLILGSLADIIGRRKLILLCLIAITIGMALSALAQSVAALCVWRVVTGLGIGGVLAMVNALSAEFANAKQRSFAVSVMAIGYPVGAIVGGSIAAVLLRHYDWRSVFVLGAFASAVLIPLVLWQLPDSIEWLIHKRRPNALERVNAILKRMGHGSVTELPPPPPAEKKGRLSDLLGPDLRRTTLLVIFAYFMLIMTFYYLISWIPKIVADYGFSASAGTSVSVWANVGGACGGIVFGWLSRRLGLRPLTILVMVLTFILYNVFGNTPPELTLLILVAEVSGFFGNAAVVGLYAIMATYFPTHVRASGTGLVIGIGRGGGVLAPIISGFLFSAGMSLASVTFIMALGAVLAAIAIFYLPYDGRNIKSES